MQIFDAFGRPVDNLGICERCGSTIKHMYVFEGKTYGSTCIEAVSGIRPDDWVWNGNCYDESATRQALAEKTHMIAERAAARKSLEDSRELVRQANRTRFAELINFLKSANGNFGSDIADTIAGDGTATELVDMMSPRAWFIIRDMWAKQYGRSNSKAYATGVIEFEEKFCN